MQTALLLLFGSCLAMATQPLPGVPCDERYHTLEVLVQGASDCRWSDGAQDMESPLPLTSLCVDQIQRPQPEFHGAPIEKQKICVGSIKCHVQSASIAFPNVVCRAQDGNCEETVQCLKDFLKLSIGSCNYGVDAEKTIKSATPEGSPAKGRQ